MKRANRRPSNSRAGYPVDRRPNLLDGRAVWYRTPLIASIQHNFPAGEITMKLYDSKMAPNPRRVRIFLAEKGIQIADEQVDLAKAQNRTPEFLKINPYGGVPVLQLDDGTNLAESVAVCRYFEETHPEPRLMGVDARDKALVEMWQRRMELNLLAMAAGAFRNTSDFFKGRIPQVPEYGEVCRQAAERAFGMVDGFLGSSKFIAGDRYTIADITALVAIDFAKLVKLRITPEQKNLARWYETVSSRPSAKA
jgi:glutathione S-transferase